MMSNKVEPPRRIDPRVVRTRQALYDALMRLVQRKTYDAITVQDIADEAGVRRATFYLHFRDKQELLTQTVRMHFEAVIQRIEAETTADDMARKSTARPYIIIFRYIEQHRAAYRAVLHSPAAGMVMNTLQNYIAGYIQTQLLARHTAESLPMPIDLLANYVAGAEVAMLAWWVENDTAYSAEYTARSTHELTLFGLQGVLGFDKSLLE